MTWEQLRVLVRDRHDVCGHTVTHPDLTRLSEARLWEELVGSRERLEEELLRPVDCLVCPYGRDDARVRRAARAAGCGVRETHVGEPRYTCDPLGRDRPVNTHDDG